MRSLCLALLLTLPAAAQSLEVQLATIARAHHGQVALYAENLTTHATTGISPDTEVQTASTIKLTILYEALQQIRDGKAHWEDPLPLTQADQVTGSGILRLLDAPKALTLKDALTLMVILSDNSATNLVIDHLGLAAINTRTESLGLTHTHLYKKVFAPATTPLPADFKQFGLGKTTPREITKVMQKIVTCDLGSPTRPADETLCATARQMLSRQFYRASIPRYLDRLPGYTDSAVLNKTGSLDAVRADVAAISTKSGIVLLSIFTYANADHTWGADHEAELTIARLARTLIDAWSPTGLAPWPTAPIH